MFRKINLLVAAVVVALASGSVYAQDSGGGYSIINPNNGTIQGYYSPRLQGHFQLKNFYLPKYGNFVAVRIASLDPDSPLRQIGLIAGDVVTRLDGVQIRSLAELEVHAYDTGVRYIKAGSQYVQSAEVYIPYRQTVGYPPFGETP